MMKPYSEEMSCDEYEYNELVKLIENINKHFGKEIFTLESTEDYETECVDIYENGELISDYMMFEDAINYLKGVENGALLMKNRWVSLISKQIES